MQLQEPEWRSVLNKEFEKKYMKDLLAFLQQEKLAGFQIYPPENLIFKALELTPFKNVKVVILGQDPYHGLNQANGLAFSVHPGIKLPPSLKNIFKELQSDLEEHDIPDQGDLTHWAKQGVLLLNATLTVRAATAGSHQKKGWEIFTDTIIRTLSENRKNIVFILWGNYAIQKENLIDQSKHFIIKSAHPSPLAAYQGFWGSKPFSRTNEILKHHGLRPIDWKL